MRLLLNRFAIPPQAEQRQGGTATIYRAVDTYQVGRTVAIKEFAEHSLQVDFLREAFNRELKSLNELHHKNIATLFDWGDDEVSATRFMVLEWLDKTIMEAIQERELEGWWDFYDTFGVHILEALSYAHERGVIHRDIKPENIMIDELGTPKIVDFGIAKFKMWAAPGLTLVSFKSPPYAPDFDSPSHSEEYRDVFGFGALAIACLTGRELDPNEDLSDLLDDLEVDSGIHDLISRCLSSSSDRFTSVEEVIRRIEELDHSRTSKKPQGLPTCAIEIPPSVLRSLQPLFGRNEEILRSVENELEEVCGFARWFDQRKQVTYQDQYALFGASCRFRVKIDENTRSYLVLLAAIPTDEWMLDRLRQSSYAPRCRFVIGRASAQARSTDTVFDLIDGLGQHEADALQQQTEIEKDELFLTWEQTLKLQWDLERANQKEIRYTRCIEENGKLVFFCSPGEYQNVVDQRRIIYDKRESTGLEVDIEAAHKDRLICTSRISIEDIPLKGSLMLDASLAKVSRRRQEYAFDQMRSGRSARFDLRELLADPSLCRSTSPRAPKRYYQEMLDERKRQAVSALLGNHDFLVVNGPPGTGKTQLIAECILQFIEQFPSAKILLTSQTHNAIDNSLEKISQIESAVDLKIVRIARRDDPRVSASVREYLLPALVEKWVEEIKSKSYDFLEHLSETFGVDSRDIELGLLLEELRSLRGEADKLARYIETLDRKIGDLEDAWRKASPLHREELNSERTLLNNSIKESKQRLTECESSIRSLKKDMKARFGEDAKALISSPEEELILWEDLYLRSSEETKQLRGVVELVQDWHERFGKTEDFQAAYLSEANVVAATCISIGSQRYADIEFDLCIMDEASKASPLESLPALIKSKQWMLVGDPNQLPPFVGMADNFDALVERNNLTREALKTTILDRLIPRLPFPSLISLNVQYRMCGAIGDLISACFYDDDLLTGRDRSPNFVTSKFKKPICWVSTSGLGSSKKERRQGSSYYNKSEIDQIEKILLELDSGTSNNAIEVAVLSFYASQVEELRMLAAKLSSRLPATKLTVESVDAFQGRQADVCIISTVRSNNMSELGFVNDRNRLNVALSRGREALILVGDLDFFRLDAEDSLVAGVIRYLTTHPSDCAIMGEL